MSLSLKRMPWTRICSTKADATCSTTFKAGATLMPRSLVDEGPQILVGAFHMEGNKAFSEDQLAAYTNTATGQPFSEYNISQDRDNLVNYYFNRGFPHASFEATAKAMPDNANRMD